MLFLPAVTGITIMYHFLYSILYLLSLLPWWVLYALSDFIAFMLFRVFGYRKAVVMSNLQRAFPKKTEEERKKIAKRFYRNLCDNFVETIKLLTMSAAEFDKRVVGNFDLVADLHRQGLRAHLHCGHFFNWEFIQLSVAKFTPYTLLCVYMPVTNEAFDRIMQKIRRKFGSVLLPTFTFKTSFHQYKNTVYAMGLAADQASDPHKGFWVSFFGKLAPFAPGPEKSAQLYNVAVVFANFYKVKRGHYRIHFTLETTTPRETERGEITKRYVRFVEDRIRERPDNYLWSHRRWKWEYNDQFKKNLL